MSKPVNKTAIGVFTVVAALLLFACVVFFGSFSFGKKSARYVVYIEDSANGLDIGSAVKFKGVKIGSVRAIDMRLAGQRPGAIAIPVIIEIDNIPGEEDFDDYDDDKFDELIRLGLRARTQFTSVVTGLLYIDLDFVPGSPIVFRGNKNVIDLPEIPTVPSNTGQMMKSVSAILQDLATADFTGLSARLRSAVARAETGISKIEFKKINDNVVRLTGAAADIVESPELQETIVAAQRLVADIDTLSNKISGQVDPVSEEIKTSLADLRATLVEIGAAAGDFRGLVSPERGGTLARELDGAVTQIDDAARAVRALAEYLHVNLSVPDDAPAK